MTKLKNSNCDKTTVVIETVVTVVIVTEVTGVIVTVVIVAVVIFTSISKNNLTPQHPCDVFRAFFCNLAMFFPYTDIFDIKGNLLCLTNMAKIVNISLNYILIN